MSEDFEKIKKVAFNDIYFEAGSGLMDSQNLEYALKYLIYLLSKIDSLDLDKNFCKRIIDDEEKFTCGQLIAFLSKRFKLQPTIEETINPHSEG